MNIEKEELKKIIKDIERQINICVFVGEKQERKRILEMIDEYFKEIQEIYDNSDEKELIKPISDGKLFTLIKLKSKIKK